MLVHDQLIFLQLQKTACTHIAAELQRRIGGRIVGKHQALDSRANKDQLVVGSVRNPWDWYVSLWTYGCSGQGMVHNILTQETTATALRRSLRKPGAWPAILSRARRFSAAERAFWQSVYSDPYDPTAFKDWLLRLLKPRVKSDVFDDMRPLNFFDDVGLYTARYAQIFSLSGCWAQKATSIRNETALGTYLDCEVVVDRFIKMEQLEEDLASLLCDLGYNYTADSLRGEKRNTSKRRDYQFYHDDETIALIAKQDRLVANRHNYIALS